MLSDANRKNPGGRRKNEEESGRMEQGLEREDEQRHRGIVMKKTKHKYKVGDLVMHYFRLDHFFSRIGRIIKVEDNNQRIGNFYTVDMSGIQDLYIEQSLAPICINVVNSQISLLETLLEENKRCLKELESSSTKENTSREP